MALTMRMGHQLSIENASHSMGQQSPEEIHKDAQNPRSRLNFHSEDQSNAVMENAPVARTQVPSRVDMPRLLGQEHALVARGAYSEKDGQRNQKQEFRVEEQSLAATENASMIRTPTPLTAKAPRDPEAGKTPSTQKEIGAPPVNDAEKLAATQGVESTFAK